MKRMESATVPAAIADPGVADRRRPGRRGVNPHLLPLLREPGAAPGDLAADAARTSDDGLLMAQSDGSSLMSEADFRAMAAAFDEDANLAGPRGIMLGLALSVPMWAVIFLLGRTALRLVN